MTKGLTPYVDGWDNKGPLLYLIEYLGLSINLDNGIFYMQFLATLTLGVFLYKTALMFANSTVSVISTIYCIILMRGLYSTGNSVEEYALPFIAIGLYVLTKYIFNDYSLTKLQLFIVGACASACLLLRINLLTPILAFCTIIFIHTIIIKKYKQLINYILFFTLGLIVFASPFVIYLIQKNALAECLSAAYSMNFNSDVANTWTKLSNCFKMFQYMSGSNGFILYVLFVISSPFFIFSKYVKGSLKVYLACLLFALIMNAPANMITGYAFEHYFLSFIPLMIFPALSLFKFIHSLLNVIVTNDKFFINLEYKKISKKVINIALIFCLFALTWGDIELNFKQVFDSHKKADISFDLVELVKENTKETDLIQMYNGFEFTAIYMRSNRQSASKFYYTPFWNTFLDSFRTNAENTVHLDIKTKKPKLIIVNPIDDLFNNNLLGFVDKYYEQIEFNYPDITIYKLK